MLKLSVLDQSPIPRGGTPADGIRDTLRLAEAADALGYQRYWLAEHHSSKRLASPAPEILIGQVAARTSRLRVGSGGVMLSHYSALKVAESFRTLETLFPGRIDLGIGRAPGSDRLTAQALASGPGSLSIEYFPHRIADLVRFLHDDVEPEHPFAGVHAMPTGEGAPEMWLLGSSGESASFAAHFGLAFSFAQFITPEGGPSVTRAYARAFRPSKYLSQPLANVGVFVICADTEERAAGLEAARNLALVRRHTGRDGGPYPTVEEAAEYQFSEPERAIVAHQRNRTIAGVPSVVRARLESLAAEYEVDEMVVVTVTADYESRQRSYELLAHAFEMV
ncbi:MAG: LLM class flavin-dependent oxidoreductase [Chloroflexota bacterium]